MKLYFFIYLFKTKAMKNTTYNNKPSFLTKLSKYFLFILFFTYFNSQAQTNLDFETGTLNCWTTSGNVLLVSSGVDPYGNFPVSAPGGNFSVKLEALHHSRFHNS